MTATCKTRSRACDECGESFQYPIGRGLDRRFCSDFCRGKRRHKLAKCKPLCITPGCSNHRVRANPAICNTCDWRMRRTGTTVPREWKYRSRQSHGYVRLSNSDHPLAINKFVYEHRQVLYDAIGEGPHECHGCAAPVRWIKGKCYSGSLVPDHLDGDNGNNHISNLVPACNRCNATRGLFMSWVRDHKDDPWLWAMFQDALGGALKTGTGL